MSDKEKDNLINEQKKKARLNLQEDDPRPITLTFDRLKGNDMLIWRWLINEVKKKGRQQAIKDVLLPYAIEYKKMLEIKENEYPFDSVLIQQEIHKKPNQDKAEDNLRQEVIDEILMNDIFEK
ncbi:MAG: hypothetical protein FWC41_00395 [Firmicutes bacterium]|nr:hypothetical protein [Bacillota bacterium]